MLAKRNIRFVLAVALIPFAVYLNFRIPMLPNQYQLYDLYLKAAGNQFLVVAIEILIEYFVIHGIVKMTDCLQNNWHNNEMLLGWILAMISKGLLVVIRFFFGNNAFYIIYTFILVGATIYYVNRLFRTLEFKPESE